MATRAIHPTGWNSHQQSELRKNLAKLEGVNKWEGKCPVWTFAFFFLLIWIEILFKGFEHCYLVMCADFGHDETADIMPITWGMAILFISTSSKHSNGFHKLLKELSIISAHRLKSVFQPQKSSTSARRPHSCSILFSSAVLPYRDMIPRREYLDYR